MKTITNKRTRVAVCAALVIFVLAPFVLAQDADTNPAVLYMRAFMLYEEPGEDLSDMLEELRHDNIKPNEQIRRYLEKNKTLIELVTTASQMSNCDWGWDLSNIDMVMPELSYGRKMAFMLVYDSKVLLDAGDYKKSLERCLTIYRMAGHFSDDLIIPNLVSIAMSALASGNIRGTLSQMPADVETLEWLKNQMQNIPATSSIKSAINNEMGINAENFNSSDETFFDENIKKMLTIETRKDTELNATNAAIEIYLIKARTGQLPGELPVGLPKDLFSDKDFMYEKTSDGFFLKCQGKDLSKDETYEYEFKVKK